MSFGKGARTGGSSVVMFGRERKAGGTGSASGFAAAETDSAKSLIFGSEDSAPKAPYIAPGPQLASEAGFPMPPIRSMVNVPRQRRGPSEGDMEALALRKEEAAKSFHEARQAMQEVRNAQMRNRQGLMTSADEDSGRKAISDDGDCGTRSNADLIATGLRRRQGEAPQVFSLSPGQQPPLPYAGEQEEEETGGLDTTAKSEVLRKSVTINPEVFTLDAGEHGVSPIRDRRGGGDAPISSQGEEDEEEQYYRLLAESVQVEGGPPPVQPAQTNDGQQGVVSAPQEAGRAPAGVLREKNGRGEESNAGGVAAALGGADAGGPAKQPCGALWAHEAKKKGGVGKFAEDKELAALLKATDEAAKAAKFNHAAADAFRDARAAREMGRERNQGGAERVFGKPGQSEVLLSVSGARRRALEPRGNENEAKLCIFGGAASAAEKANASRKSDGELQAFLGAVDEMAAARGAGRQIVSEEAISFHDARAQRQLQVRKNRGSIEGGLFGEDQPKAPPPRLTGQNVITWA